MPLAIELAAACVATLTPGQTADRLGDSLTLLRRGSRSALTRQQTLAATLAWSHDLLNDREQRLFRRLSVFAGSFTLEAVEAICGPKPTPATTARSTTCWTRWPVWSIRRWSPSTPRPVSPDIDCSRQFVNTQQTVCVPRTRRTPGSSASGLVRVVRRAARPRRRSLGPRSLGRCRLAGRHRVRPARQRARQPPRGIRHRWSHHSAHRAPAGGRAGALLARARPFRRGPTVAGRRA